MADVLPFRRRVADGEVGLDRISLSFPVKHFEPEAFPSLNVTTDDRGQQRETYTASMYGRDRHEGASIMVGVRELPNGWWGKVECNPARFADPGGCSLYPLRDIDTALQAMQASVELLDVQPSLPVEVWRVKRLDLARDFRGVSAPEFYVRGLAPIARPYARRSGVWSDAQRGSAQTLHVGSGSGMVRLYDQHAAYAGKGALPGALRWELEARDRWLAREGLRTCQQLVHVAGLEDLALKRWEWSRMGETVTGAVNVVDAVDRIVRAGGYVDEKGWHKVSPAKGRRLLGDLVAESLGTSWSSSRDARAEYERLKAHLGVRPSAELFQGADVRVAGRLDFEQGREVVAA